MEFGLKERIPIWITLLVTGVLLGVFCWLFSLVDTYRAKVVSPLLGGQLEISCRYAGADFSTMEACTDESTTNASDENLLVLNSWKDQFIDIQRGHLQAPDSLSYRISKVEVAPYWSLKPPELKLTFEVGPKANVEPPTGLLGHKFSGCVVLLPDYWRQEEEKASETLKKIMATGDSETISRAQAYINELRERKRLLASAWRIDGDRQIEVRSYSSVLAISLSIARYLLIALIVIFGLIFGLTLLGYLIALKSE